MTIQSLKFNKLGLDKSIMQPILTTFDTSGTYSKQSPINIDRTNSDFTASSKKKVCFFIFLGY